jgi:hypothetical protein
MLKKPSSMPPVIEKVGVSRSGSVAVTVVTAVVFSTILTLAVAPAPSEVISGSLLTAFTVIVAVATLESALPSLAT